MMDRKTVLSCVAWAPDLLGLALFGGSGTTRATLCETEPVIGTWASALVVCLVRSAVDFPPPPSAFPPTKQNLLKVVPVWCARMKIVLFICLR